MEINKIGYEQVQQAGYQAHAGNGVHYYISSEGAAPTDNYYGFVVTGDYVLIDSITFNQPELHTGDIKNITLVQGAYYPIAGGYSSITLSRGDMILLKEIDIV